MNERKVLDRLIYLNTSACRGEPAEPAKMRVEDDHFVFTLIAKGGAITPQIERVIELAGIPKTAEVTFSGKADGSLELTYRWPSVADALFQPGGILDQNLDGYEMRPGQLHMARAIQRSIEMKQALITEGPTGTGKSLTYLLVGLAMGKKILISTSNKALQAQLYHKDAPFAVNLLRPGANIALAQGKGNYVCLTKTFDEHGNLPVDNPDLVQWLEDPTCTGNLEDTTFPIDDDTRKAINVDSGCVGRKCERYFDCYYYEARRQRHESEVVICNHSLLIFDQLYPIANILPQDPGLIVIDEAHQLVSFTRNALGAEFDLGNQRRNVKQAAIRSGVDPSAALASIDNFEAELRSIVNFKTINTLPLDEFVSNAVDTVAAALNELAWQIWPEGAEPQSKQDAELVARASQVRNVRSRLIRLGKPVEGDVRWLDLADPGVIDDRTQAHIVPHDVSDVIGGLAGFADINTGFEPDASKCQSCGKPHGSTVFDLNGYGICHECKPSVDYEDVAELITLEEFKAMSANREVKIQARNATPIVFCSATLASPDFETVKREWGVPFAYELIVESPFNYKDNAAIYAPNSNAPAPNGNDREDHINYVIEEVVRLVRWSGGGAFILFTSNYAMQRVSDATRYTFEQSGMKTFVQGELPKVEMVKQFTEAGNGVLFGTRSFFEGVDVKGDALRLVVLDKLPFEPITPLREAEDRMLRKWAQENLGLSQSQLEWYPFNKIVIPRMIVELKQVFGRLIRTQTDAGVFALLDNRIRTKQYGRRNVMPALPKCPDFYNMAQVAAFFEDRDQMGVEIDFSPTPEIAFARAMYQMYQ